MQNTSSTNRTRGLCQSFQPLFFREMATWKNFSFSAVYNDYYKTVASKCKKKVWLDFSSSFFCLTLVWCSFCSKDSQQIFSGIFFFPTFNLFSSWYIRQGLLLPQPQVLFVWRCSNLLPFSYMGAYMQFTVCPNLKWVSCFLWVACSSMDTP